MKKIILFTISTIATIFPLITGAAGLDREITCSPDLVNKYSCKQCFDGGAMYVGESLPLYDIANNDGIAINRYYKSDIVAPSDWNTHGAGIVTYARPEWQISNQFFPYCNGAWCTTPSGKELTYLKPNDSYRWIQTLPNKNIGFVNIDLSKVNDTNRANIRDKNFTLVYTLNAQFRSLDQTQILGTDSHVECQSIGAHFCGDGIVEPGKEVCDEGGLNGQPGHCNTSCTEVRKDTPACASIVASPTFGRSPFTTTLTCNGTNLPAGSTYAIDCGNGANAVMNGNVGTCTYTNLSPTASATFSPKCTINGTLTAPACQTNIGVNPGDNTVACIPGTITGNQTTPVTANTPGLCPAGQSVGNFTATPSGNITNYSWSCGGSAVGGNCVANYPPIVLPTCIPGTITGNQTTPVTANTPGLCPAGQSVGNFTATPSGNITNYSWSCGGSAVGGNCVASHTTPLCGDGIRNNGELCDPNDTTHNGWGTATPGCSASCTPVDTPQVNPYSACVPGRPAMSCNEYATQAACLLANPASSGRNCYLNDTLSCNANRTRECPTTQLNGFDLSLKKYIGTDDAQIAPGVSTTTSATLNYVIRVTNSGASSVPSSGVTTVQDILPAGVEYGATAATGVGWTCAVNARTLTCTSTQVVQPNGAYPDITVPFRVTATAGQTVTNIAAVDNPTEINRCKPDGTLPLTDTATCTLDVTNSDPAVLSVPGPTGCTVNCGGVSHVGKRCINGVATCATFNSIIACEREVGSGNCRDADAAGQAFCASQQLVCSGPGGCNNPNGCLPYRGGYCGDGIVGSSPNEECDVPGAPWCDASCKIVGLTQPGANPITAIWMRIPVLSKARLGYNWLDAPVGGMGKIQFEDNRMVLGVNTSAFTVADTVGFGIKTQYPIPLVIEASKKICLKSDGNTLTPGTICTTFGEAADLYPSSIEKWQRPIDGKWYVNIGKGSYQRPNPNTVPPTMPQPLPSNHTQQQEIDYNNRRDAYYNWRQYLPATSQSPDEITLFKGSSKYFSIGENVLKNLNTIFLGKTISDNGTLTLYTINNAGTDTPLVVLPVKVSGARISSVGSSSNRAIESFINPGNLFTGFLTSTTIGNISTTRNNDTNTTVNVALPTIPARAGGSVATLADIELYAVNGNKNVLAVNGNLTIESCPNNKFEMSGVRTVIVSGDLIIKCNIGYPSSDATSSWAWITKGGNIQVSNGIAPLATNAVTNLAGVYVSVKEGTNGGNITYTGSITTQAILRVDGSIYGNAKSLFDSRLYARATGAYEILTTGTILTYSNRALVNPPPLLSQYLGNYQVQRVVQ